MTEGRLFTIRDRKIAGSLLAVVDTDDLEVEEICPTCRLRGVISVLHPDAPDEHKGSPHFKPWERAAKYHRDAADRLDRASGK